MEDFYTNVSYRPNAKRKQRDGSIKSQPRYILSYRTKRNERVKHKSFNRKKDADRAERELIIKFDSGELYQPTKAPTIADGYELWMKDRTGHVKKSTLEGYKSFGRCIVGPLLDGTQKQRHEYTMTGVAPAGIGFIDMLGNKKATELTTAEIRVWHKILWEKVGSYSANQAKQYLAAILNLLAEDFGIRPPAMPRINERRRKEKKRILTQEEFQTLLQAGRKDKEYGLYYIFPFLTGVRPSEQLGLLWSEVDFEKRVIKICRIQERDGSLSELTKTEAGTREIPMSELLYNWLKEWKQVCPRHDNYPHPVFPNLGYVQQWPKPRREGGKTLLYYNFRSRIWNRAIKQNNLPHVTPHSARHFFISTLQAKAVEVGLVAKLAGHSNPSVTLGHYTQAVRGGEEAVEKLVETPYLVE